MCGIAGAFHPDRLSEAAFEAVRRMQRALGHRGPDGEGWFQGQRIALAHRRLSIIDLSGGAQPLTGESAGTVAIVNGEIYNYIELQQELAADGARLRTRSDSEVVPFLYERHGEDFVHRLRGAFAAAIWDESRQQLLLVRDRLGEKPLLYATGDDGTVYFASEIGALVASGEVPVEPDMEAINRYFHFRFVPEPATPLRHVRKLRAGHLMALSPDSPLPVPRQYWNVSAIPPLDGDPVEILRADLDDIGRIIVRSDVPVGVALSGGLDSSIVASLAVRHSPGKVTAFSVGYEGRPESDERADASAFARHLGIDMIEVELSSRDVVSGFDGLVADMGEPIADAAGSSYRALMQAARRAGIKVMFQGQGADELFWSYGWMRQALAENVAREANPGARTAFAGSLRQELRLPAGKSPRALAQWLAQGAGISDAISRYERLRQADPEQALFWDVARPMDRIARSVSALAGDGLRDSATLAQARGAFRGREAGESWQRTLVRHNLATYLLENGISQADRYSMAAGVEARLPFVDYKLVEHAVGLNDTQAGCRVTRQAMVACGRGEGHPGMGAESAQARVLAAIARLDRCAGARPRRLAGGRPPGIHGRAVRCRCASAGATFRCIRSRAARPVGLSVACA
ncbi:asparagine synthase (glutamine-hydrolyzing) [Thermomonas sp.]|uniref:asparagine synthase (glutamine-hydrolyzing) n=1 Tax=Thermomonas sp. TaxID=1971895 RepID=UPI001EBD3D58|nr:asparagine synthase (glutamine-hydrolyzing) [Thermomonas sp.]MBK6415649.1 asparagine synthase (glutamine-hydrolyzing) [Thermomonas sp.]